MCRLSAPTSALLLAALLPCAVRASPQSGGFTDLSLEELGRVNVSAASLLTAGLLDAGSTVYSITQDEWQRRGARRLLDALEGQPGVIVMPHVLGNQVMAIRGFARSNSFTGIATTWDDVPLNDLLSTAPQFILPGLNLGVFGHMQLIQGPGSALYGNDAFHGVLALRSPDADAGGRAAAALHSNGFAEAGMQLGVPLSQRVTLSLAAAANGQPNQALAAANGRHADGTPLQFANRLHGQTATLRLQAAPQAGLSWFAGVYAHHYRADGFNGFGTQLSGSEDIGWVRSAFRMGQGGVRQQLGDGTLEVKGYGWRVYNDSGSILQTVRPGALRRDLISEQYRRGATVTWRAAHAPWHTEWALAASTERLGVDQVRADLRALDGTFLRTLPQTIVDVRRAVRSVVLEANTQWAGGRWRLVYGGRIDDYSDVGSHRSPRLGLVWRPAPGHAFKLLYGHAFRAPSTLETNGDQGGSLSNPGLQPEVIDTLELVALRQTESLLLQAVLYRSLWRDGISSAVEPSSGLVQYRNLGRNASHGATVQLRWQAGGWLVDAAASYACSSDRTTGADYAIYPRAKVDASIGRALGDGSWQLVVTQRWQSKTDDIPAGAAFQPQGLPHYARTDIVLHKRWSPTVEATAQLRNVFDRTNWNASPIGTRGGIPEPGISAGIILRYRF